MWPVILPQCLLSSRSNLPVMVQGAALTHWYRTRAWHPSKTTPLTPHPYRQFIVNTDIYFSPPKHLQLIGVQYKSYWNIFFTATAMQNCHGWTVLDFLMDYWTISKSMHKLGPTGKREMFYLVLNSMGEYIKLLSSEWQTGI